MVNYYIRTKFRRLKELIKSKSFIGSILFATSLWGYTSLNNEYTPFVNVPLTIVVPSDKAIENPLPEDISVKVKGGGWQLFYLIYFNSAAKCVIDLSEKDMPNNKFYLSRTDILKGIQNIVDVEPIDVLPESMELIIGKITTRKVPVNPHISITPRDGFIAMKKFEISPDSIEITGNENILSKIESWDTEYLEFSNLYKKTTFKIAMSNPKNANLTISPNIVNITIDLQQQAEITIHDVDINIKGGSMPKGHQIYPNKLDVTIHGGIEQIASITKNDIRSYIEYSDLIKDSTGLMRPNIEVGDEITKFFIKPNYIYHTKRIKSLE